MTRPSSSVMTAPDSIEVFPPGFVRLVGWHGKEIDIVNAARVSFHNESSEFSDKDKGLIRFLLRNRHGTPFEQGFQSTWHIRLPIFVMREWMRHRIGHSINEESGRYVEMRPDFYMPEQGRTQVGKPGAYHFERKGDDFDDGMMRALMRRANNAAWDTYQELLEKGHAKEQARIVLPLNIYTEMRWTANARSLMHFLSLRNAPDAMYEIRHYAQAVEDLFADHMPVVHAAFLEAGRIGP